MRRTDGLTLSGLRSGCVARGGPPRGGKGDGLGLPAGLTRGPRRWDGLPGTAGRSCFSWACREGGPGGGMDSCQAARGVFGFSGVSRARALAVGRSGQAAALGGFRGWGLATLAPSLPGWFPGCFLGRCPCGCLVWAGIWGIGVALRRARSSLDFRTTAGAADSGFLA